MRKQTTIEMKRLSADEYKTAEKLPLTVILDDVRSMYNVGSVFRSADSFRCEQLCLCGITGCPPHVEIHKTALGAEDSVPWQCFRNAVECVNILHSQGYTILAIEQCHGSTMLQDLQLSGSSGQSRYSSLSEKYAIILGNEVRGVHQEAIDLCDGCIEIPQLGTKHSLNVSVTAGIIIWEFARQLMWPALPKVSCL